MNDRRTILSDEWIITGIETDKPIPIGGQPEKHRSSMKRERERRRPFRVHKISLANHIDVLSSFENRNRLNIDGETVPLSSGSKSVEVKKIMVPGVVRGREQTNDPSRIASGAGNEVSDRRRRRRIGRVVGVEVGLGGWEEKWVGFGSGRRRRRSERRREESEEEEKGEERSS